MQTYKKTTKYKTMTYMCIIVECSIYIRVTRTVQWRKQNGGSLKLSKQPTKDRSNLPIYNGASQNYPVHQIHVQ